jgi:HEPN domain-containing protein
VIEDRNKIAEFWISSSEKDWLTMNNLVASKDYSWALFVGHLVIEKLIKAYFVKTVGEHPLFIHDLLRLAEKTNLELTKEQSDWFEVITRFNLKARYEDYKVNFRLVCTPDFTAEWVDKIGVLRIWLKGKF